MVTALETSDGLTIKKRFDTVADAQSFLGLDTEVRPMTPPPLPSRPHSALAYCSGFLYLLVQPCQNNIGFTCQPHSASSPNHAVRRAHLRCVSLDQVLSRGEAGDHLRLPPAILGRRGRRELAHLRSGGHSPRADGTMLSTSFWASFRALLSSPAPHARRVLCSTSCPC